MHRAHRNLVGVEEFVFFHFGGFELQARCEGCCRECTSHGKFNEVAQRWQRCCQTQACIGIMVILIDHMPLERMRIGESVGGLLAMVGGCSAVAG